MWRRDNPPLAAGLSQRPIQRDPAQIATAIPANISHRGQITPTARKVSSPPATGLPGPGNLGVAASAAGRHAESVQEASQVPSLRNVKRSAVSVSQSAAGALSLKTRTSMLFVPVRRKAATSALTTSFQLRPGDLTDVPLIFSSARLPRASPAALPRYRRVQIAAKKPTRPEVAPRSGSGNCPAAATPSQEASNRPPVHPPYVPKRCGRIVIKPDLNVVCARCKRRTSALTTSFQLSLRRSARTRH